MTLWIILTVMVAVSVAGLMIPLVRRNDVSASRKSRLDVLREQLVETEARRAEGAISEEVADGLAAEINRRIVAESPIADGTPNKISERALPWVAVGLAGVVAVSAAGLYALVGSPHLGGSPAQIAGAGSDAAHPNGDVSSMIASLEEKLQNTPDDPQGWQMLGWSYMSTNRPADAARAYARAAELDPGNLEIRSAQAEALTQAAGGTVTPEAATLFRNVVKMDPGDPRARYYLALAKDQQGDHDGAMTDWITLIKTAPPDAEWLQEVRGFVERVAEQRGIDISSRLPPPVAAKTSMAPPAPTQAQVDAASQMSDSDRQAMIHGMVDSLAAQLKANPRDSDGWVRLMRARMVLGERDAAATAYRDAQKAFSDAPTTQAELREAARVLGVPGA